MHILSPRRSARALLLSGALLAALPALAAAQGAPFDQPAPFAARVQFQGDGGAPLTAGSPVTFTASGLAPNQALRVLRGDTVLSPDGFAADAEGKASFSFDLPADAVTGLQPVVVLTDGPDSAEVVELKVSPDLPLSGAEGYDVTTAHVAPGLYQSAFSDKTGALFVASAVGRPPVSQSKLLKLAPATLDVLAEVTPAEAPGRGDRDGGVYAVYGVAVDDANGTVWVTNTRQNTVAVYSQDDLSLIHQFPAGAVAHPRDVVVDPAVGRAYVSGVTSGTIAVFDTASMEQLPGIEIASAQRGGDFGAMSLALDPEADALYTVSLTTPEIARIDLASGEVMVTAVPGLVRGSGIAVDPATKTVFAVSQDGDNLIAVDGASGKVLYDVPVGAGPLNVAFDAPQGQLYVASRGSDSIAVLDAATGELVANLDGGSYPNHVTVAPDGAIYAVNKQRGEDADGDLVRRIVPAAAD